MEKTRQQCVFQVGKREKHVPVKHEGVVKNWRHNGAPCCPVQVSQFPLQLDPAGVWICAKQSRSDAVSLLSAGNLGLVSAGFVQRLLASATAGGKTLAMSGRTLS